MHIGIDATCWSNRRGYGRFARALLTAVLELDRSNHYTFFADHESEEFPFPAGVEIYRVATKVPAVKAASANGSRSLSDLWAVATAVRKAKVDFIYFPTDYTYVPFYMGAPRIVTIHDAISELFPELIFPTLRSRLLYRAKTRSSIRQARLIVTVSEFSRRQLVDKLKIPAARLRIVSEAADPIFRRMRCCTEKQAFNRWGIPEGARCLIYVGGFSPHKNLFTLVNVFGELSSREDFRDLRLLLVGDYDGDSFFSCYRQLTDRVRLDRLDGRILFTGRLEDQDLVLLLNRSEALVLPSFCEGFGLPGVEAAACGTPLVATTQSPLPELFGEGVLAVEPSDRAGWLRAIAQVLVDKALRNRMSQAAFAAAQRFSWKNSARQLLSVFDEIAQEPCRAR